MKIRPAVLAMSVALASVLILGGALPTLAQDNKMQQQPPPAQQTEFSQGQIEAFASAALQIRDIRTKWQSQMQGADNADKVKEFQEQASTEMKNAVEKKGLTVETYNAIVAAAQSNPELADRIVRTVKLMEENR
jgi:hypothetical protein